MSKNNRKIFLINPPFQLKFSFYVCLLIFLSSLIYPVTIFELLSNFLEFASNNVHKLPEFKLVSENLQSKRNALIIVLVLWQLGFIGIAFIANIFLTHKVAGPIFKLKKFFQAIADGEDNGKLKFRDGDYFEDLAVAYNDAISALKEDHKNDLVYLSEVTTYLNNLKLVVPNDKKVVLNEIISKLNQMQEKFTGED